jgi:hypothetical protein
MTYDAPLKKYLMCRSQRPPISDLPTILEKRGPNSINTSAFLIADLSGSQIASQIPLSTRSAELFCSVIG